MVIMVCRTSTMWKPASNPKRWSLSSERTPLQPNRHRNVPDGRGTEDRALASLPVSACGSSHGRLRWTVERFNISQVHWRYMVLRLDDVINSSLLIAVKYDLQLDSEPCTLHWSGDLYCQGFTPTPFVTWNTLRRLMITPEWNYAVDP